jgi:hypothetical protein
MSAAERFWEQMVTVAPDLVVARTLNETVNGYPVQVHVDVDPESGRLVATEVRVSQKDDRSPVTSEVLRLIPVAHLIKQAIRNAVEVKTTGEGGSAVTQVSPRVLTEELRQRLVESGPTAETLDWVAYFYRLALLLGDPPTRTVEILFRVPRSTAGRWVAAAREHGYLAAAEGPGKAGA